MYAGVILKGHPIDGVYAFITEKSWHVFYDYHEWNTTCVNWLGKNLRATGPIDLPLWFLRDLIVVTILTPVIYYAIKTLKILLIGILFLAYVSRVWTLLPGLDIITVFYFTTGAYFALNKINIVYFVNKYKLIFVPFCFITLVATTIFDGPITVIGHNIYPFFVCSGVFTAFYVASLCVTKRSIKPNKLLVSSCFFIYAIHWVNFPIIGSPLTFTSTVLHSIIPSNTYIKEILCYLISPFLTAYLCILLLEILRQLFPKLTLYFSGNK